MPISASMSRLFVAGLRSSYGLADVVDVFPVARRRQQLMVISDARGGVRFSADHGGYYGPDGAPPETQEPSCSEPRCRCGGGPSYRSIGEAMASMSAIGLASASRRAGHGRLPPARSGRSLTDASMDREKPRCDAGAASDRRS